MNDRILTITLAILLVVTAVAAQAEPSGRSDWLTYYEKSGYKETPRYEETTAYCKRLADYSPMVEYKSFGITPQGRELPLLILDKDGEFGSKGSKTQQKVVLLYLGGIHPGEIEGKDAGLMFFRDVAVSGMHRDLLDHAVILFIPIFNADGHERFGRYNRINQNGPKEMGWRTTAQNLNLNRDFMKADSPEMRAWLALFNEWLPDFLCDIHTTDGADYQYVITYGIETNTNVAEPLRSWTKNQFLPEIERVMERDGFPFVPYIVPKYGHDVTKGLMSWTFTPRFSNGYGAAQNRPCLLIETHMLKDYKTRVESVYQLMLRTIGYFNRNAAALKRTVRLADSTSAAMTGTYMPLNFRPSPESTMIDFLGVDFHFEHSSISDTMRVVWGKNKVDYRVPHFHGNVPTDSALVPWAYLIPKEWQTSLDVLKLHGVKIDYLAEVTQLEVSGYRFSDAVWEKNPFEGRHNLKVKTTPIIENRLYPAGTAVVLMNQRTNRVIAHLLEPRSPDSFVSWGFFDAILERKEYAEDYVLEDLARQMLAGEARFEQEFRQKVESDTIFAKSKDERLDFFYQRSPYFDVQLNVYPIAKLMTATSLKLQ